MPIAPGPCLQTIRCCGVCAESGRFLPGTRSLQSFLQRLPGNCPSDDGPLCFTGGTAVSTFFDYVGAPDADRVIVIMGSGAETVEETVMHLQPRGEKVGVLRLCLFRPFSVQHFVSAIPSTR